MAILVTAASKYGSTLEIGVAIRDELNARGLDAEFLEPSAVDDPRRYDAFIVGSAIYMGRWQAPAREFLSAHREVLAERPVWLFSSGPLGDAPGVGIDDRELAELMALSGARDHRLFAGKLDRAELGFGERLITRVVRAPDGDFRDWDEIRAWADEIAAALAAA
ncbi:MAG TPA: flavodoxin domain-containing protein [Thermomicrobiales bacterium]|nr:flavodoxin domain-containing protein [Thermomicrobiales bacterium]